MKRFKISIILLAMCMSIVLCGFGINKNKEPKEIHVFEGVVRRIVDPTDYGAQKYIVQSDDGVRILFVGERNYNIPKNASNQLLTIEGG